MLIGEVVCMVLYPDMKLALIHDLGHLTACLIAIFLSILAIKFSLGG